MLYLETSPGEFTPWCGEPINDIRHPLDIEWLWSPDELATVGLYDPEGGDPPPDGFRVADTSVQRVAGTVKHVHIYEAISITGEQVNRERDRRVRLGTDFALTGGPTVAVAGDDQTKVNLHAMALAAKARMDAGDVATLTPYRDENNAIHNLTPPQLFELWSMGSAYISAIYQASWVLKDNPAGVPTDYKEDTHWP